MERYKAVFDPLSLLSLMPTHEEGWEQETVHNDPDSGGYYAILEASSHLQAFEKAQTIQLRFFPKLDKETKKPVKE